MYHSGFAGLSNHFHLVLRSRPDVVATWDDREVARRWYMLCPERKHKDGSPCQPNEPELNSICNDPVLLSDIRLRLSDISWWMRLVCQRIAQWSNAEDEITGKFWQNRFRAVRLLDEESILACAAYVDLNPIRAAVAQRLEESDYTSARRRTQALLASLSSENPVDSNPLDSNPADSISQPVSLADSFLAPLEIDELHDELGPRPSVSGTRCSDKGFLSMPVAAYLELLDWTARQLAAGKQGSTPTDTPAIFERLQIRPEVWCKLVSQFGQLFSLVAGKPQCVDDHRSRQRQQRFYMPAAARELLSA